MTGNGNDAVQISRAVHGRREISPDPQFEADLARWLHETLDPERVADLYSRFAIGDAAFETMMRRVIWRAVAQRVGDGLQLGSHVGFRHLETFEFGSGVFVGAHTHIQGWYRGVCRVGSHVWIGPHSYFDARDLVIEDYVGWGPGAKVLCSMHAAVPLDVPIVQTDLHIRPVRICEWADIGTNAIILPGVTVGRGSIVGAGAVVTEDVPPLTVVAGVPARVIRSRESTLRRDRFSDQQEGMVQ